MEGGLFERVNLVTEALTDSQRVIACHLLNSDKAAFQNAAEIAAQVGVSESTVVRFARALGFRGFPDLQGFLREALLESLSPPQTRQLARTDDGSVSLEERHLDAEINNLRFAIQHSTPETIDAVAGELLRARATYIAGLRSSRAPAVLLGHFLHKILPGVKVVTTADGLREEMPWIDESDVLFAFSFPRYSMPTLHALQHARGIGATTVVVSDSRSAPAASYGKYRLIAPADSSFFGNSFTAAVCLCNLIVSCCVRMDRDRAIENLRRAEGAARAEGAFFGEEIHG